MKNHEPVDGLSIMMTSHPKQQRWLERTIESFEGCPYPIFLGYDDLNFDCIPDRIIDALPEKSRVISTQKKAGQLGHARGELFQMNMLIKKIKEEGYKYFYKTAGDCIHYRWRGFSEIHRILNMKDFDIVCRGTSMIYGKVNVFHAIMDYFEADMMVGSAEGFFRHKLKRIGAKVYPLKNENWELILGRIHVQGEYALNQKIEVSETWKTGQIWKC